jgi:hypothetical protein
MGVHRRIPVKRTAALNLDPNANGTGKAGWVDAVPNVTGGTLIESVDLNRIQEELCNAITQNGGTLDAADLNWHQLADVIGDLTAGQFASNEIRTLTDLQRENVNPISDWVTGAASGGTAIAPLHLVVGPGGKWSVSKNHLKTWSGVAAAGTMDFISCAFSSLTSTFVAVGINAEIRTSNTAVTSWTARTSAVTGDIFDVREFGSVLIAVGSDGSVAKIQRSTNGGVAWTAVTAPAGVQGLFALANNGSTIVAAGTRGANGSVCRSTDGGLTWVEVGVIPATNSLFDIGWHQASGLWYTVNSAHIVTSPDLSTWTQASLAAGSYAGLVFLPHIVGAVRNQPAGIGPFCVATKDGVTWSFLPSFGPPTDISISGMTTLVPYYGATHSYALLLPSTGSGAGFNLSGWSSAL